MVKRISTRQALNNPEEIAKNNFKDHIDEKNNINASFLDSKFRDTIAIQNLPKKVPFINELFRFPQLRTL
ncbi:MAG: hypothetical protein KGD57_00635, partial [Candidatus Lokiarchaeota archaeon]|nr:hypothetical protein [Candidatus Lokiarchaeota archaeon]